jgi:glycosyltransferase involved in cell wall biosynthesis
MEWVYSSKKTNAYVEKINYFKKNRDELIRMGNNARKSIEEGWTWKIQAENIEDV